MPDDRKPLGDFGERLATAHLQAKGYRIVDRKFRLREAEIDLIAIDGDQAVVQRAADAFNFRADMVPAGTYPFMDKAYPTVRQWVSLLVGAHVSDEVVYKYVKAIAENEARVQGIGGSLKTSFARAKMVNNPSGLPFHPGAARYYKEAGLLK